MQTEILREFVVLANYRNFRKAADQLHIAQPTLSNHITALERELGFKLFEREGGTHLTTAGAHFYTTAQHVLDELSRSIAESRDLAKENPPVKLQMLGKGDSALNRIVAQIETPFQTLPMDSSQQILASLEAGEADVLCAPYAPLVLDHAQSGSKEQLEYLPIGEIRATFLVSKSNPLAKKESLSRDDLRKAEILIPYGNLYDWMRYFAPETFGEECDLTFIQDPSLPTGPDSIPLRGLGQRIMLNYRDAAHRACQSLPDIVAIDKFEGEDWGAMEYLIYRKDDPNPNVRAFVDEVRELVESETDERAKAEDAGEAATKS